MCCLPEREGPCAAAVHQIHMIPVLKIPDARGAGGGGSERAVCAGARGPMCGGGVVPDGGSHGARAARAAGAGPGAAGALTANVSRAVPQQGCHCRVMASQVLLQWVMAPCAHLAYNLTAHTISLSVLKEWHDEQAVWKCKNNP